MRFAVNRPTRKVQQADAKAIGLMETIAFTTGPVASNKPKFTQDKREASSRHKRPPEGQMECIWEI